MKAWLADTGMEIFGNLFLHAVTVATFADRRMLARVSAAHQVMLA